LVAHRRTLKYEIISLRQTLLLATRRIWERDWKKFLRAMSRLLLSLLCYPQCLLKKFLRQIAMSRLLLSLLCYPQCLLKKFHRQIAMSRLLLSLLCYPQGQDSWIHCTQMKGRQSRMERDTRDGSKLGSKGLILEWRWTAQTLSDS
jgi:hypothetical protein